MRAPDLSPISIPGRALSRISIPVRRFLRSYGGSPAARFAMLTLQSVIVILIGWSAIYWHWTETRLAVLIGFVAAYLATVAVLAVRGHGGAR
jgi:hypothetical protein